MAKFKVRRGRKPNAGNSAKPESVEGILADGIPDDDIRVISEGGGIDEPVSSGDDSESGDSSGDYTNPESAAGSSDSGSGDKPRKRGRPKGSTGKSATKTTGDIEAILFSVHQIGASLLSIPELELDEKESKKLSEAITAVTELYDIPLVNDKQRAWGKLLFVAGGIYAPRIMASTIRNKRIKLVQKTSSTAEAVKNNTPTPPINFPTGLAHA